MDLSGSMRGTDGVWDRGAYEYGGSTSTALPAAPIGLHIQ
jgi:hypothetical protein